MICSAADSNRGQNMILQRRTGPKYYISRPDQQAAVENMIF
jgi:hypothetical protein